MILKSEIKISINNIISKKKSPKSDSCKTKFFLRYVADGFARLIEK